MIDLFKNFVNSLLCIGIFITFIKLIMPSGKVKKYIYSLIGIITITTIVSPFINFMQNVDVEESIKDVISNIDMSENTSDDKAQTSTNSSVKDVFLDKLKTDIKDKLTQNSVTTDKIEIYIDDSYNIEKMEINIKNLRKTNSSLENVNKVVNYINQEYGIAYEKINIIEEGV